MKILLTNDDGIESKITRALFEKLRENHDVTLIAPKHDKSGQGAAITLRTSVQIEKQDENIYAVDGTPADCVFMGLMAIMKDIPDIIVSGINKGANMGDDVIHSGTLGAAFTGRKLKYPPIATSISGRSFEHFESAVLATELMLNYVSDNYHENEHTGLVFNVNIPNYSDNNNPKVEFTVPSLEIDENNISEDRKSLEKGNISISALTPILYSHDNNDIARSWTKKLNN